MENQFEIYITYLHERNSVQIWMIKNDHNGRWNMSMEGGSIQFTNFAPGNILDNHLKPLLELPMPYANELFREINQEFSRKGIKTKDESRTEGVLEATEKHLSDMQTIAFKLLNSKLGIKNSAS